MMIIILLNLITTILLYVSYFLVPSVLIAVGVKMYLEHRQGTLGKRRLMTTIGLTMLLTTFSIGLIVYANTIKAEITHSPTRSFNLDTMGYNLEVLTHPIYILFLLVVLVVFYSLGKRAA